MKKWNLESFILELYEEMTRQLHLDIPLKYDLREAQAASKSRNFTVDQQYVSLAIKLVGWASVNMMWSAQKTWEPKNVAEQLIKIGKVRLNFLRTDAPPGGMAAFWADAFNSFGMAYATVQTTGEDERTPTLFVLMYKCSEPQSNYLQPESDGRVAW